MTGRPEGSAPGLAVLRALLWLLPRRHREVFLGDLMEEYETFVAPGCSAAAARWGPVGRGRTREGTESGHHGGQDHG